MTERSRFCVLFTGTEETHPVKTRLLYNDSSREDILLIWKQIYNEEAPSNADLIINENCVYKLDDDEDIVAFLAQAEDQYKLLPSQPLRVTLGNSAQYWRNRNTSPTVTNDSGTAIRTPPPTSPINTSIPKPVGIITPTSDLATDLRTKREDTNSNNNNRHYSSEELMKTSPDSSPSFLQKKNSHHENKHEPTAGWAPSLMMLYNRYRGEEQAKAEAAAKFSTQTTSYNTVGGAIESITSASALTKSPNLSSVDNGFNNNGRYGGSNAKNVYENPYAAYTKHLANALARPTANHPADFAKSNDAQNRIPEVASSLPKPAFNLSAYSAFMNNLQEQRLMQNNPSASYILQTILNNHMKGNTQGNDGKHGQKDQSALPPNYLDQKSSLNSAFMTPQNLLKSPNHTNPAHPFQAQQRSSSLLSSLAHYNSNSFLSYMNGANTHNLQNVPKTEDRLDDFTKKALKKRKRHGLINENTKPIDGTKRMRSSISQSNIEYHYQRALDYSQMAEEDQKLQNSAHRSHWKHLLYVAKISPRFLEQFRHAKYDEWSSEARDIFAICQPDKYMWSFLTLSKQGDMLCKRITARIDGLLSKSPKERPDWCPEDERLLRAQTRAKERLSQLQRILYSRSVNQEAKAAEKANELEKLSVQEKNLALVKAYQQRQQQELLQNHQAMMVKHVASLQQAQQQQQQQQQQQEHQHRHPVIFPNVQGPRCSSLTSSPISMASPAFEDNSAGSGCSESPREDRQNEGDLVIVEDKQSTPSSEGSDDQDIEVQDVSPLPFVKSDSIGLASPQKWSKIEQVADV